MERAIAYIRVSTDRQAIDGTSLVSQKRRVEEHVGHKNYELVRLFSEEGESAKTDGRPVLQEMLAYCKMNRGRINILIFPKIDRFARYTEDYHFLKRYLRNLGIRVESTDERFDDSPSGKFMENVLAAQAQYDNDLRSERAKTGMREAVSDGRWVSGHSPIGYRNTTIDGKSTIEPDPIKGPFISEAFERLAWKGIRPQDVRRWLATKSVVLSTSGFDHMIKNRIYVGIIEAFGLVRTAKPPLLPLVSEATFYKAREAIRAHKSRKVYQRDNADFPLRGTLKCECGRYLTASWSQGRSRRYPYYRCLQCTGINLHRQMVHNKFLKALNRIKCQCTLTEELRRQLDQEWKEERSSNLGHRDSLSRDIKVFVELQRAIVLKNAQGVVPDEVAKQQLSELLQKIEFNKQRLEESHMEGPHIENLITFAEHFLARIEDHWLKGDLESKKQMQSFLFPQGATIDFTGPFRTAEDDRPTGSMLAHTQQFSSSARRTNESPNRSRRKHNPLSAILQFFRELYEEFADVPVVHGKRAS